MPNIKLFKVFVLFVLLSFKGESQTARINSAIFRDTIPLFIQSQVFSGESDPRGAFLIISDTVKIYVAEQSHYLIADELINVISKDSKALNNQKISLLQFRLSGNKSAGTEWQNVHLSYSLVDTVLSIGQSIYLQFRIRGQKNILQETVIKRGDTKPTIISFRNKSITETSSNKEAGKSYYVLGRLPKGSIAFHDHLTIAAGNELELVFNNIKLNEDSLIEYSLVDLLNDDTTQWLPTGHLLTLTALSAKHKYYIRAKYKGQRYYNSYQVTVLPYWWQEEWAIGLFVLLSICLSALVSRIVYLDNQRKRNRQIEIWSEKSKTGQHKLDTHWIDNMFNTAMGFIRAKQNDKADEYLGRASDILRNKLITGDNLLVPLIEDTKMLENVISIERLKTPFLYAIQIDPSLDLEIIQIPPSIWQPSLENAIKHGLISEKPCIVVKIFAEDSNLIITIADNGQYKTTTSSQRKGFGIPITKERVKGLNMTYPEQNIVYEVDSSPSGTLVTFIFEKWLA